MNKTLGVLFLLCGWTLLLHVLITPGSQLIESMSAGALMGCGLALLTEVES